MPEMDQFCSLCGEDLARKKLVRGREGEPYCLPCHDAKRKVQSQDPAALPGEPAAGVTPPFAIGMPVEPEPEPLPDAHPHPRRTGNEWTPSLVILGISLVVLTGLQLAFPSGDPPGIFGAIVAGVIRTIFVVVATVALLASLAITLQITGGTSIPNFAKLLARALGLMLAVSIVDFFAARDESFWVVLFGFRGVVMIVALICLFKLEIFETMVLSFIHSLMGWGLAIALGMALLVSGVTEPHHAHADDQLNDAPTEQPAPAERDLELMLED